MRSQHTNAAACLLIGALGFGNGALADSNIRFATFNASLTGSPGDSAALQNELAAGIGNLTSTTGNRARAVAEIIQRTAPDVLLLNEFDYNPADPMAAINTFRNDYLSQSQNGAGALTYDHVYVASSNTGIASGFDLNNDGNIGGPDDAFGFGRHPGEFSFAILSKFEIDTPNVRSFQQFRWADMPGALLPSDPNDADGNADTANWFTPAELAEVRLSSKNHVAVPIKVGNETINVLASHPTPPVFDGPEDRNGTRNHDEIRLWKDFINNEDYLVDDNGQRGGLADGSLFVIMGDQNADPFDGDSVNSAIRQLLDDPLVNGCVAPGGGCLVPSAPGGVEDAAEEGAANAAHVGNPAFDTADFNPFAPGNLRVDYLLPSDESVVSDAGNFLTMQAAGIFWPEDNGPFGDLVNGGTFETFPSDHRLTYVDLQVTAVPLPATLPLLASALAGLAWGNRRKQASS